MRALFVLLTVFCLPAFAYVDSPEYVRRPLAYVYKGTGVCEGCSEGLASTIQRAGFRVEWISPGEITFQKLLRATLFAVPGGEEEVDVKRALSTDEDQNIRDFVSQGGLYLGVCLGVFLAPQWLPDAPQVSGLKLFSGVVKNHSPTKEARMEIIHWKGHAPRWMYFQDGPEFRLPEMSDSEVWAKYHDGTVAALQAPYGLGKVGLVGPHPEADQAWLDEDHLVDPDGADGDLLIEFLQGMQQNAFRAQIYL